MRPHVLALILGAIGLGSAAGVIASQAWFASRLDAAVGRAAQACPHRVETAQGGLVIASRSTPADGASDIRALRLELARLVERLSAQGVPPGQTGAATAPPEVNFPSPEEEAARQSGEQTLSGAIAQGEWTEDDDERFWEAMAQLRGEQRLQLGASLARAFNEGRLRRRADPPNASP